MIEHSQLQSLLSHISHTGKKRSLKSDIMHPKREWALGLGVAFVLLVCVTGVSLLLYFISSTTPELTAEQVNTVVPYRAVVIEAALEEYRNRESQYQDISQSAVLSIPEESFNTATSSETEDETSVTDTQDEVVVDEVLSEVNQESEDSATNQEAQPSLETSEFTN